MTPSLEAAAGRPVPRETVERLEQYCDLVRASNLAQNLVSASTLDQMWDRHILDSAQLVRFEPVRGASWVDIGSGAGLPGLVIALLVEGPVTLIEPRRLRAEFLGSAVTALGVDDRVQVLASKAQNVKGDFAVITGRAVASLDRFLVLANHLADTKTWWVLPKGRNAESELAEARRSWQCSVRSEPSITDPASRILVLSAVRARGRR